MFGAPWSRWFIPIHNPLGFGVAGYVELFLACVVVAVALFRIRLTQAFEFLAGRPVWCACILAFLPAVLRLALLFHYSVPAPNVADEFSHLLVADTLRHLRFANPSHPFHQFFETFFELQTPTYSSIYPIGQGITLAFGRMLFGSPWAGVILATCALCALTYWALRAWTTPRFALLGGLICVMEFGPLSQWMNSYWGGAFAAVGGCLVFGALARLQHTVRRRDAVLLGAGLAIDLLTRPYETMFLLLSAAVFLAMFCRRRSIGREIALAAAILSAAFALLLIQNKQITRSWTTMPYAMSQYQYGVPVSLTFQADPSPHNPLTPQQQSEYEIQRAFKDGGETLPRYFARFAGHLRYLPFFFMPPLYVALIFVFLRLREPRLLWVFATLLLFLLGITFFPAFHFHYLAPATFLFVLLSVLGLERLAALRIRGIPVGSDAALLVAALCIAQFAFWYGLHLAGDRETLSLATQYESWDALNNSTPTRRVAMNARLKQEPGDLLVFVRYYPQHPSQDEWVWNAADIDAARIVWARDLGETEDLKLRRYYPRRTAWLLEPDFRPLPRLTRIDP